MQTIPSYLRDHPPDTWRTHLMGVSESPHGAPDNLHFNFSELFSPKEEILVFTILMFRR
jgi:hypothetical protein